MNPKLLDILNTFKHKHKFPPRDKALEIKSRGGASQNSMGAVAVTRAYIESASAVLEDFTEAVLRNRTPIGLTSESEISEAFLEAFNTVTTEARGCALSEFGGDGFKRWILHECDEKLPPLLEQLNRKVRLKDLDLGGQMNSIQITGGHIGNLVLGSVTQSKLTATVTEIVKLGGSEAQLGQGIQSLIEAIGRMGENHKSEQTELFDLLKGLLQQIRLPKEEQSRSTIKTIWERVVQVSQVSTEVAQIVQTILPMIYALLGR